jgi:hypothetical protein
MVTDEQLKELESHYEQYKPEQIDEDTVCEDCQKRSENNRYWWESGGYEYPNEGHTYCDECGLNDIHQYDDFDEQQRAQPHIL